MKNLIYVHFWIETGRVKILRGNYMKHERYPRYYVATPASARRLASTLKRMIAATPGWGVLLPTDADQATSWMVWAPDSLAST